MCVYTFHSTERWPARGLKFTDKYETTKNNMDLENNAINLMEIRGWSRYSISCSIWAQLWPSEYQHVPVSTAFSQYSVCIVPQCSFVWYGLSSLFSECLNLMPVLFPMDISSLTRQGSTCGRPGREVHHWQRCHNHRSWAAWWKCHHVCCYWSAWDVAPPSTTWSL